MYNTHSVYVHRRATKSARIRRTLVAQFNSVRFGALPKIKRMVLHEKLVNRVNTSENLFRKKAASCNDINRTIESFAVLFDARSNFLSCRTHTGRIQLASRILINGSPALYVDFFYSSSLSSSTSTPSSSSSLASS